MKLLKKTEIEIIKDFKFGKDSQYKVMVIQEKSTGEAHLCWQNVIPSNWKICVILPSQEGNISTVLFK